MLFRSAGCDGAVDQCLAAGLRLADAAERTELRHIADAHTAVLSGADLAALGYDSWRAGFEAGIAAHHAGMVPPLKEAVEEAFARGLVKVVFATETLALGINMPARSVVIEKLSKFTGEHHEFLTPGEYTQLTGRAGRRGIDDRGFAVVPWSPFVPFDQVAGLASRRTSALTSSFRPTYNMTANLVERCDAATARHLLNLSFAQFRADRDVVGLERQLERGLAQLAHWRAALDCDRGDMGEYRRLLARERARSGQRRARRPGNEASLAALRPGSVIRTRRGGGWAVVLRHDGGRGNHKLLVLGADGTVLRLGAADFDRTPVQVAFVEMPRPFAPKNPAFRREVAGRLRAARLVDPEPELEVDPDDPARHPVASCPEIDDHLRAIAQVERLERETSRLERRVRGRSESLARQFDRVLRVLESWGYVDGWSLTPAGRLLTRLNAETDLLIAEAIRTGQFDGLSPVEVATLASVFTYEHRGPEHSRPPAPRWPGPELGRRWRQVERAWRDLSGNEDDAGLPETRPPDPGLVPVVHAWASGRDLHRVLDLDEDLTGGDFVRHVKQLVDLLRQIAIDRKSTRLNSSH